jgi:hypothetical protein
LLLFVGWGKVLGNVTVLNTMIDTNPHNAMKASVEAPRPEPDVRARRTEQAARVPSHVDATR